MIASRRSLSITEPVRPAVDLLTLLDSNRGHVKRVGIEVLDSLDRQGGGQRLDTLHVCDLLGCGGAG